MGGGYTGFDKGVLGKSRAVFGWFWAVIADDRQSGIPVAQHLLKLGYFVRVVCGKDKCVRYHE
jgi:hypothetical protein